MLPAVVAAPLCPFLRPALEAHLGDRRLSGQCWQYLLQPAWLAPVTVPFAAQLYQADRRWRLRRLQSPIQTRIRPGSRAAASIRDWAVLKMLEHIRSWQRTSVATLSPIVPHRHPCRHPCAAAKRCCPSPAGSPLARQAWAQVNRGVVTIRTPGRTDCDCRSTVFGCLS